MVFSLQTDAAVHLPDFTALERPTGHAAVPTDGVVSLPFIAVQGVRAILASAIAHSPARYPISH